MGIGLDVTGKANETEDNTEKAITAQGPQRERGPAPKVLRGGARTSQPLRVLQATADWGPRGRSPPRAAGKREAGAGEVALH